MGLNLSNQQIAQELDLHPSDAHQMTCQLRQGIVSKKSAPALSDEVECDEVYIVAGHKGQPDTVKKKAVWTAQTAQGQARTRHTRHGEAPDLRDDPARW